MDDTQTTIQPPTELDPNVHLYQWLNDNNYELTLDSLVGKNPFLSGQGFVMTDRPLLVVKVTKKEAK